MSVTSKLQTESCIFKLPEKQIFEDRLNIMIIDDSKKDLELFEDLIKEETKIEFSLYKYSNPKTALDALPGIIDDISMIVLDLAMPSINGHMLLDEINKVAGIRSVPVVIHSSSADYESKMKSYHLQADAFFLKPLNTKLFKSFVYATIN